MYIYFLQAHSRLNIFYIRPQLILTFTQAAVHLQNKLDRMNFTTLASASYSAVITDQIQQLKVNICQFSQRKAT